MRVLFIDGTKGFDPKRLSERATGGILTSLTIIPRYLASEGHDVYVKSTYDKSETIDRVHYMSLKDEVPNLDVVVFNRNVLNNDLVRQAQASGAQVVWWLHDIVDHRYLIDDAFKKVNHIVSLSNYCTKTYSEYYGIPKERFIVIPNGVDKKVFWPGSYSKRNKNLFVYAAAPIKGMKPLAFTFRNIKRHLPEAELRVYSSQGLHDLKDDAIVNHWMDQLREEKATILDPIPQEELADVFREAWALLMPNSYPEICSNIILQARACGLPIVTSPVGSIPEFVENEKTGLVTKSYPHDLYFWWAEFARLTLDLCTKDALHKGISELSPIAVKGWEDIGHLWHRYLLDIVAHKDIHRVQQEVLR